MRVEYFIALLLAVVITVDIVMGRQAAMWSMVILIAVVWGPALIRQITRGR